MIFRRRYPPYPIRSAWPIVRRKNPVGYRMKHQFGVKDEAFLQTMHALTGSPLQEGNRVDVLCNGDEFFPSMFAAMRNAKNSINLETYIYWDGDVGRQFAEAIAERSRAGVNVRVILDAVGSAPMSSSLIDFMRQNGVELTWYHPIRWYTMARINHRTHRKLLIVDGRVGYTGGFGIADEWLGNAESPERWRETVVRVQGPAVIQMQFAFMDNWVKARGLVPMGGDFYPKVEPQGSSLVHVIKSSPSEGVSTVKLLYAIAMVSATKTIYINNAYFIPDEDAIRALEGAVRRGVDVRIIVPGRWTDVPLVREASRWHYDRLLKRGIRIFEYEPTMMHAKTMVIDGIWTTIGSSNFDERSFRLNDEVNVGIYDEGVSTKMDELFRADLEASAEIKLGKWQKRSWLNRTRERIAGLLKPQL
ncbi:MAG TPA: cardiolipin synthase [Thermoanaerobaculia bacterium]|nr:cardiolipin synthase [Thermoanaerobaculia bacterium]